MYRDPELSSRPCICGGGVAGAEGDQTATPYFILAEVLHHMCHAAQHPAHLVRTGALQVFRLQTHATITKKRPATPTQRLCGTDR